ncbi:MAG TPA: hypothetical protein PK762_13595 [Candidatus Kapabacteria bacterium]|nr:hypothetical protein [Candidatus Kapabacteria bacterium]
MKTKILLLIATAMLFAMPLLATTTESDTVWTKRLFPCEIKGSSFSLTGDSIIAIAGAGTTDTLFILETATGNILKKSKIKPGTYSLDAFTHFNTKSWVAICLNPVYGGMYIYNYIDDKIIKDDFEIYGHAIAISSNDKYIYLQNNIDSPKNISIFSVEKNEFIDSISSGYGAAHSLAISPDDKYLAIGTGKSKIVNPDPENPDYEEERMFDKIVIIELKTKEVLKEFDGPTGTQGKINEIKFSPDGKYLGIAKLDGTVRVYDMINLELYLNENIGYGYSSESGPWIVEFSEDSEYLYCGLFIWDRWTTEVWNIKNKKRINSLDYCSYIGLNSSKNNNLLTACGYNLTYLFPNWLTSVKEFINNKDIFDITINKSINTIFHYHYKNNIQNVKLFNYTGNVINTKELLKINIDNIEINSENLQNGVYFLIINENKQIKILVTE